MIAEAFGDLPPGAKAPEVLVVGAGAVGIALAILLARNGKRVTLLEAGPAEPAARWRLANAAQSTGLAHLGLGEGRMQALGGTTRLWGGQLQPFTTEDLAPETWPGKPGWPIAFADLRDATARALALLGMPPDPRDAADIYAATTGREARLDSNIDLVISRWLRQPDFARLFGSELAGLAGLSVLTGHRVTALDFSEPGLVSQVRAVDNDGSEQLFSAETVVLANGTFELVGLLLRTARADPACGFAKNPHLGRWFFDHLHAVIGTVEALDRRQAGELFDSLHRGGNKLSVKLRASSVLRSEAGIANAAAMLLAPFSLRELVDDALGLARRVFGGKGGIGSLARALVRLRVLIPVALRYLVKRRIASLPGGETRLGIEVEQVCCAESRIELDPADPSRIALHWALDGAAEMRTIRSFALAIRQAFAERRLGRVMLDPLVEAGDPAFLAQCHDAFHQMGGARMAESAADGVVDADLRVFGTRNLHVLGAATFPSGSFANPTLTALALAVRLADRLSGRSS